MIDHDARHFLTRVFVLLLMFNVIDDQEQTLPATRSLNLGNAAVARIGDHSIGHNPAGIVSLEQPVLSELYSQHFLGSNTHSLTGKIVIPTAFASFGAYGHYYSFESYYQTTSAGMIVARSLLNDLAIGMSANYHLTYIPDELQRSHFSFDVGAQYSLGTIADIGLSVRNLQRFFIKDDVILDQSTEIRLGSSYRFSYQVLLAAELSYFFESRTDFALGLEYLPMNWLVLRGGTSVNPFMQYIGAGIIAKKFNFDVATSFHPHLGYSPQVSIDYRF